MRFLALFRAGIGHPLSIGILLSIVVHLLVLFGHRIDLSREPDVVRLDAVLARTAPDKKPGQAPLPDQPPKKPVPKPKAEEAPLPAKAEATDPPIETPPPPQPEPEQNVEDNRPPEPEAPALPPEPPTVVGNAWPRSGVIRYYLFGGESRDPAGASTAEMRWEISDDGKYSMKLEGLDAKPFPSMPWFTITFSYASRGRMVEGQFIPDRYEEAISVFHSIVVNFNWEKNLVDFAGHSLPLSPGTMDYLSVIMQAGDPGFIERGIMSVATGRGLRQYRFQSLGESDLVLPFGMTWKTRQLFGMTGNNDVRVWVATEKFNLPVQIKFVVNKVNYYLVASEVLVAKDALLKTAPVPAKDIFSATGPAAEVAPGLVTASPDSPRPVAETPEKNSPERQN